MENKVMINKCKAKERSWGLDGRLCQLFSLGHVTVSDDCDAASRGAADTVWRCELHLLVWGIRLRLWQNPALEMPTELINNTNSCQRGGVWLTTFFFFFAKATEMILPCCCFSVSVKCSSSPLGESNDRRCSVQRGLSRLFQAQGDFFKSFKEALRMKRISSSRPRN